jgi:hypothetical protein
VPRLLGICCVALTGLLAGCGGGEQTSEPAPGSPEKPLTARPQEQAAQGPNSAGEGSTRASKAKEPGYQKLVQRQSPRPRRRFSPCTLVTVAEARAILRAPMLAPVEAPQGPTCIYRTRTSGRFITVAVQKSDFKRIQSRLKRPKRFEVSSRVAYCGDYGQPVLYVRLGERRVLSISGPCTLARQFAVRAVRQLTA